MRTALYLLHKVGMQVVALTFDGLKCNFAVASNLGANLSLQTLFHIFLHPVTQTKVYCMVDACHMLKLVRNLFEDFKELKDYKGNIVSWDYIEKLDNLQKRGLVAANKIKKKTFTLLLKHES